MSPFPKSGGTHLSLCFFWGGGTPLFPRRSHLSASSHVCGSLPLALHSMSIRGVQPRAGSCLLQSITPTCCSTPLLPSHPPSWIQGLPLLPLWGNCWVRMAPALMEPRGHSAMDKLWGQHWELFCTSQECQVLVTLCPVPHCQCSASGDTLGGKEHGLLPLGCMALPGVGDLWWLGGASDQPRT